MTEHTEPTDSVPAESTTAEPTTADAPSQASPTLNAPAKFLDPETGDLRVEALMKSYTELEKRMGAGEHLNRQQHRDDDGHRGDDDDAAQFADDDRFEDVEDALLDSEFDDLDDHGFDAGTIDLADDAIPDSPNAYRIDSTHPWLQSDDTLNGILHENGFTQDQAQLLYDLANEHVLPLMEQMTGKIAELSGQGVLRGAFGDDWERVATQTRQWGEESLPPDLFAILAATPNGVAAMHQMMHHGEPGFLSAQGSGGSVEEAGLRRMMEDPRYWRDHDPDLVAKVQDGFQRLYPD